MLVKLEALPRAFYFVDINQQIPPAIGAAGAAEIGGKITSVTTDRGEFVVTDEDGKNTLARLAEYGLDDTDFSAQLRGGLDELRFVEVRFRPSAHITAPEIEAYYRDQYVPKMRSAGAKEKPLTDVRSQIEEILVQQQVDSLLSTWLQNLRSESDVHVLVNFGIAEPKPVGTSGSSSQSH